jgi:hypothetical protein
VRAPKVCCTCKKIDRQLLGDADKKKLDREINIAKNAYACMRPTRQADKVVKGKKA